MLLPAVTDVAVTVGCHRRGPFDPAFQVAADGAVWRCTRLASGAATVRVEQTGPRTARATAWGDGAAEALDRVPAWLGAHDDTSTFAPPPGVVREAWRRSAGVRMSASGNVLEALVPAILEQKVVTRVAHGAWRWLLHRHGDPAPGPVAATMRVPPAAETWAAVPVWDFHRAGVEPRAARTVVTCARLASTLEATTELPPAQARRRWQAIPGVGPWTAAETAQRALGDADALSVGDFHLAHQVGWALTGERTDDAGMLELLAPFAGHRHRVTVHLLVGGGARRAPRYGPRATITDHRAH